MEQLLEVKNLVTTFHTKHGTVNKIDATMPLEKVTAAILKAIGA